MRLGQATAGAPRADSTYRYNCQVRSRLLIVSWNGEEVLGKIEELSRWLSDEKADVTAIRGAQGEPSPYQGTRRQTFREGHGARETMSRSE